LSFEAAFAILRLVREFTASRLLRIGKILAEHLDAGRPFS
jgi:hypothetical protein